MTPMELSPSHYDAIIVGSSLPLSITAAALAHAGKSVLHVDENEYYGADHASLSLGEIVTWAHARSSPPPSSPSFESAYASNQRSRFSQISLSFPASEEVATVTATDGCVGHVASLPADLQKQQRAYSLSLSPTLVPSLSPLIGALVASGVSRYATFRLLESTSVFSPSTGQARRVPSSKEDVFREKKIGLVEKRRLMKCLLWCAGEFEKDLKAQGKEQEPILHYLQSTFSLSDDLAEALTFALTQSLTSSEPALPALTRARSYLRSVGKFGNAAFLVGQYGGAGEVAQGFCRLAAVQGAIYILSHPIESITFTDDAPVPAASNASETPLTPAGLVSVQIRGFSHPLTTTHLVTSSDYLPDSSSSSSANGVGRATVARCIALFDSFPNGFPVDEPPPDGAAAAAEADTSSSEPVKKEGIKPDTALLVFPPGSVEGVDVAVEAVLMGENTASCPAGKYIVYLTCSLPPNAAAPLPASTLSSFIPLLSPSASPSLLLTYLELCLPFTTPSNVSRPACLHLERGPSADGLTPFVPEEAGRCAEEGERLFWEVLGRKKEAADAEDGEKDARGFFEPSTVNAEGDDGDADEW